MEEGAEGLVRERRDGVCKASGVQKDRPPKLENRIEEDLIAENQHLRMEIEYLKTRCLSLEKVARGKEKVAIVNELRQRYLLSDLLQLSGLARSTFYYYIKEQKTDKYGKEKQEILDIFNANKGRCGCRRILMVLRKNGYSINHKTVLKLMNILGLKGKQRKNDKYHSYKGEGRKVANNLLERDFHAEKPFEKLTADVTQFKV